MAFQTSSRESSGAGNKFGICTAPADFSAVREELEKQGLSFLSAEVNKIPQNMVSVDDPEVLKNIQKLLDMLEDNDDVQNVYHNCGLPEEEE